MFPGAGSDFFSKVYGNVEKTTGVGGDRDQNTSSTTRRCATQDKEF